MTHFENKIIKQKNLDSECSLKISENNSRIFVEFSSSDGKLVLQKNFQNSFDGKKDSQVFAKTIKSIVDLKKYFGLIKETKKGKHVTTKNN